MRSSKIYSIFVSATLCLLLTAAVFGQNQTGKNLAAALDDREIGHASLDATGNLRVQVGKSLVVNSQESLQRVSVTNSDIASALIVSPTQLLIHGMKAGTVTLILWDDQERMRSFNLTVELDLSGLGRMVKDIFPNEAIQVSQSGAAVVLTGSVSSKAALDRATALAATQGQGGSVVNLLVQADSRQVVMLQVKFAEVDRSASQELGMNLMLLPPSKTIAAVSTQTFAPPALGGGGISPKSGGFTLTDLLNVFVYRPDIDLAATIKALQAKNVLQILAEPNILALDGHEASFLAGGEFPFPVVNGTGAAATVSVQFREFGVRLTFTPQVLPDGSIHLAVAPEVSSLDFANALSVSGITVPALSTRKAKTEVELRDGQSFAIAGLIDNRTREVVAKVPLLGDVPILGNFFKSRSTNKSNSELLVLITPRIVRPLDPSAVPSGPAFPQSFLDREKFDGPAGETRRP